MLDGEVPMLKAVPGVRDFATRPVLLLPPIFGKLFVRKFFLLLPALMVNVFVFMVVDVKFLPREGCNYQLRVASQGIVLCVGLGELPDITRCANSLPPSCGDRETQFVSTSTIPKEPGYLARR